MKREMRKLLMEAAGMTYSLSKQMKVSDIDPETLAQIIKGLRYVADSLEHIMQVMLLQRNAAA